MLLGPSRDYTVLRWVLIDSRDCDVQDVPECVPHANQGVRFVDHFTVLFLTSVFCQCDRFMQLADDAVLFCS